MPQILNHKITNPDHSSEEIFSFTANARRLHGVLHLPPRGQWREAIIFSHGWSGNRCGPADLLTELARTLAEAGYAVLRFDFSGRGESEGEGLNTSLLTMADDLCAASLALQKSLGCKKISYLGLCSGANVIIGTLKRLPEADKLLLLSVYPFSDGDTFARDLNRTRHFLHIYWRKACRAETWARLVKGEVRLKQVLHVLLGPLFKRGQNQRKEIGHGSSSKPGSGVKAAAREGRQDALNAPRTHLRNLRPDLPLIFVYGSADPDAQPAEKYYREYAQENKLPAVFRSLDGANHNFSSVAWRQQLKQELLTFLQQ
jgi:pimeloyl-ACP methyl ester carboxylesterase